MQNLVWYFGLIIIPLLFGLWAQWRVKSTFARAAQVRASSGFTGREVAEMILESSNIKGVRIERVEGTLSDHYDPREKVLRLSPDVYEGRSSAALGVAAHEVGHAIQDDRGYAPLVIRNGIVPMAMVGNFGLVLCGIGAMAAAFMPRGPIGFWLLLVGIALFSLVVLFQLVNLPVEFDASNRAKRLLASTGLIRPGEEAAAMNGVLNAAALTYVAGTVASIGTLLYYVLIMLQSQSERR